jgi:hypothetical protein
MSSSTVEVHETEQKAKTLRVRVVDHAKPGAPAINVKMPVGVVKFGLKMARSFAPEMKDVDVDWDAITAVVESGEIGKIVEVEDEAEHKTVEVWIE